MPSPQSRVAQVEATLKEHDSIITELRASAADFKEFRSEVRESFRDVRAEVRDTRDQMDRRFERMDQKIDRHFMWTVALMATTLVAIVGSYYR